MVLRKKNKSELLAPAGSINVFERAIEAGADAVYIGAPALNARALSKDFSPAEIAAMIDHAHTRGVKLYLAANSLLKEDEIPQALDTLAMLDALQPDGLIIQDLGVLHLCKKYFPQLRLHASTLLGAHNSLAVRQFEKMGFDRIVLARELTVKEISTITRKAKAEIEVFIHGALCFSYSGLCIFSSYLGGKSGMRGRCVQPCRRRYHWNKTRTKPGYFFSMNDLSGIDLIHRLQKAGVSSFKIEGRLKSSHYVSSVVKAYRMILDAEPGNRDGLAEAKGLLDQAMGRKTVPGYLNAAQSKNLISPYHSGNIGLFLGKTGKVTGKGRVSLLLKRSVEVGDRLRLHQEGSGNRVPFTLKTMTRKDRKVKRASRGDPVMLEVPAMVKKGDSIFKVNSREARDAERKKSAIDIGRFNTVVKKIKKDTRQKLAKINKDMATGRAGIRKEQKRGLRKAKGAPGAKSLTYIKIDNLQVLKYRLPIMPDLLLVELNRRNFKTFQLQRKTVKKFQHKMGWCLPPIIMESEFDFFKGAIDTLINDRFRTWQVGHIGQQLFFDRWKDIHLLGDYTLNILNSQALFVLQELYLQRAQVAIETDKKCLQDMVSSRSAAKSRVALGLTVYGTPPLFTSRSMAEHFLYGQPFVSPKGESFVLHKAWNSTVAFAEKPFSLLSKLNELGRMGLKYVVIDLSHQKITRKESEEIGRELTGKRPGRKLSTFNYNGTLL
jgi:putative protease